jgi:RNA polymerase sigma-70 factor (ECF subfamily)
MTLYTDETDEELFALLSQGQQRAFSVLYTRYWDRLLEEAFYKLKSQTEAEGAVQQVFLDIWNNRFETVLKYSFRTYISAALRYVVFAKLALRKRNVRVSIDSFDIENDAFIDDSTQQWLAFNDVREKLESTVRQLPEKCEMVFRLSREKGLTTKEIALELNISPKTVEAHMSRALRAIKSALNQFRYLFFL